MDAVASLPHRTELRQALDGAWYPFDGDKDTPSYKSYYGDSAERIWKENCLEHTRAFIIPLTLAKVTSQRHSEPTVSMSSNDEFNPSLQSSRFSPLAWLSNHSAQGHDSADGDSDSSMNSTTIGTPFYDESGDKISVYGSVAKRKPFVSTTLAPLRSVPSSVEPTITR